MLIKRAILLLGLGAVGTASGFALRSGGADAVVWLWVGSASGVAILQQTLP